MQGELVFTNTEDLVRLHGIFYSSDQLQHVSSEKGDIDAAILIHGLGGNFYNSRMLSRFAKSLVEIGVNVLVVNTRGHEMINTLTWAGRSQSVGAAFENVSHCQHDITGWIEFLAKRKHDRILLLGHSLGAIKSLYAQAHAPHPNVKSIIGLSATRLSYSLMMDLPGGDLFRETYFNCESLVNAGRGQVPIQVKFPFPTWMTPTCYVEKYGPDEKYNWMRFIDKINVPTLLMFGGRELEENDAFAGLAPELENLRLGLNSIDVVTIENADHFYAAQLDEANDTLIRWLTT